MHAVNCFSSLAPFVIAGVACALFPVPAFAQVQPPLAGRPENYSSAVGAYTIRRIAVPTEVVVEDPILLTVFITGSGPKGQEPKRELLKLFPADLEQDFFVEAVPEKDRYVAEEKTWEFVYRLRPKHLDVNQVPALQLVHFNPELGRYQPARTREAIALTVKPRPVAAEIAPAGPLVIPPGFEKIYSTVDDLRPWRPPFWATPLGMILAFVLPPVGCGLWYWRWRRKHSATAQAARRRYHQAALKALHALRGLKPGADGERLAGILAEYVQVRLELPAKEPTAEEVVGALRRRRLPPKTIEVGRAVAQNIDAARFGRAKQDTTVANPLELAAFIGNVEEALC